MNSPFHLQKESNEQPRFGTLFSVSSALLSKQPLENENNFNRAPLCLSVTDSDCGPYTPLNREHPVSYLLWFESSFEEGLVWSEGHLRSFWKRNGKRKDLFDADEVCSIHLSEWIGSGLRGKHLPSKRALRCSFHRKCPSTTNAQRATTKMAPATIPIDIHARVLSLLSDWQESSPFPLRRSAKSERWPVWPHT